MLYFAYGSNMDCAQMRTRCPLARFVCVAKLPNHRLTFSRNSKNRGCGVADVIGNTGHEVWGIVYEIDDPRNIASLDQCEGVPSGAYVRKDSQLVFPRDNPEQPLSVSIYFTVKEGQSSIAKRRIQEAHCWRREILAAAGGVYSGA
jgi:gamma-glutamylcyclotransferase (GGCT)/AIG2-like uncharacterized protein YtfP